MNDIESRLADAMAARAAEVEPHDEDDALNRISERVNMNRRRGLTVLGIAAAVMIAVGAVALLNRDDDKDQNVTVATDSNGNTTTTIPPATVIPTTGPAPIWPFESMNRTFATPEEAAKSFAVDYLGMTQARVGDTGGNEATAAVGIFPNDRASLRTVVHLENQPPRGWVVVGASADMIELDTPASHDQLSPSMVVAGRSLAFEAQINVELRPFGSTAPVFEDFTMGGGSEVLPFSTTITPPFTDQPLVLVLFEGDPSGQGTMSQATVIPLDAAGSPEPAGFVAINNADELVHLDFAGHIQTTLGEQIAEFSYAPATNMVAFTQLGEACSIKFIKPEELALSPRPTIEGSTPIFNIDGTQLAYESCTNERRVRNTITGEDTAGPAPFLPTLPANVSGTLTTTRGRFGTQVFFDGSNIASYNPTTGAVVKLVTPAGALLSLDADESGRFLLWVDVNHDLWKWSGAEPVKVGSGFISAAW